MLGYGLDRTGLGKGQVAGNCECGNERSGSIKCGEFLDRLNTGFQRGQWEDQRHAGRIMLEKIYRS
jgi:hypothetical protein